MNQIVPLDPSANQTLAVSLSVDGNVLRLNLELTFTEMAGYWMMSVSDVNGILLLSSIPLVTGDWPAANILAQYSYLAIGSAYIINAGQAAIDYPDAKTLGSQFLLLWSDTAA